MKACHGFKTVETEWKACEFTRVLPSKKGRVYSWNIKGSPKAGQNLRVCSRNVKKKLQVCSLPKKLSREDAEFGEQAWENSVKIASFLAPNEKSKNTFEIIIRDKSIEDNMHSYISST